MSEQPREETRWYVIWRYGGPDGIAKAAIAALALLLVACVITDWGFGAGLLGFGLGFLLTVFAFTSNHFRMNGDRA